MSDVSELSEDGASVVEVTETTLPMESGRFRSLVPGPDRSLHAAADEGMIQTLVPFAPTLPSTFGNEVDGHLVALVIDPDAVQAALKLPVRIRTAAGHRRVGTDELAAFEPQRPAEPVRESGDHGGDAAFLERHPYRAFAQGLTAFLRAGDPGVEHGRRLHVGAGGRRGDDYHGADQRRRDERTEGGANQP